MSIVRCAQLQLAQGAAKYRRALSLLLSTLFSTLLMMPAAYAQIEGDADKLSRENYAKAFAQYKAQAESGDPTGQNSLAELYYFGYGVAQSYEQAVQWYRKAAEQGSGRGQNNLGFMYYSGQGVKKDHAQAVLWYRKAADQGHAAGQNNLGFMYAKGYGVTQNFAEAVQWYRKAAEQGYTAAQNNLGVMYEKGWGVTKDHAQAVEWYWRAVEKENPIGQKNLAYMYRHGYGVAKDYAKAVELYNLAQKKGEDISYEFLGPAVYAQKATRLYDKVNGVAIRRLPVNAPIYLIDFPPTEEKGWRYAVLQQWDEEGYPIFGYVKDGNWGKERVKSRKAAQRSSRTSKQRQ